MSDPNSTTFNNVAGLTQHLVVYQELITEQLEARAKISGTLVLDDHVELCQIASYRMFTIGWLIGILAAGATPSAVSLGKQLLIDLDAALTQQEAALAKSRRQIPVESVELNAENRRFHAWLPAVFEGLVELRSS